MWNQTPPEQTTIAAAVLLILHVAAAQWADMI